MVREYTNFVLSHPWKTEDGVNSDHGLVEFGLKRSILWQCLSVHHLFEEQSEICSFFAPLERFSIRGNKTEGFPGILHECVTQKSLTHQVGFGTGVHQQGYFFLVPSVKITDISINNWRSLPTFLTLFNAHVGIL